MYEFTEEQNKVINRTATMSLVLGILLIIWAIIRLCTCHWLDAPAGLIMGICLILVFVKLRAVTTTEGNDIENMMSAINITGWTFLVRAILSVITMLILVIVAILQLLAAA